MMKSAIRNPTSPLLGVQLDYQLLLRCDRNVLARGALQHASTERVAIDGDPRERCATRGLIHGHQDRRLLARLHADANLFPRLHQIARDVDVLLIHFDVAVPNELSRRLAARRESHAVHDVVEATLERREQVVPRDSGQLRDALEGVAELLFAHAVDAFHLLLLTELLRVLRRLAATGRALPVLTRGVWTTLHRALLGEALRALEKQLRAFSAAEAADRSSVAHRSDPPALRRTPAAMLNLLDLLA